MLETVLGIGGQLLGGIFGNRSAKKAAAQQRAWALEDQRLQFTRLREAAELGGFNPLAVLGSAPNSGMVNPTPVSSNNYVGEAIASSSLILADSLAKTKAAASGRKVEDLNRQKDILQRKLANATLRPTVPGVFDRARAFGTGVGNGKPSANTVPYLSSGRGSVGNDPDAYRPLGDVDAVDPRREVDNLPVNTHSGFMVIDNPYLPKMYVPTLDGDEPLSLGDIPAMIALGGQVAMAGGETLTYGGGSMNRPGMSRETALRLKRQREAAAQEAARARRLRSHGMRFDPFRGDAYYRPGGVSFP